MEPRLFRNERTFQFPALRLLHGVLRSDCHVWRGFARLPSYTPEPGGGVRDRSTNALAHPPGRKSSAVANTFRADSRYDIDELPIACESRPGSGPRVLLSKESDRPLAGLVQIDVRNLVFPLIAGRDTTEGFRRTAFRGTGFFVSTRGLALTAAHVVDPLPQPEQLRAALPQTGGSSPMRAAEIQWAVQLPKSDIAVVRVNVSSSQCFVSRFDKVVNCEDVETTGLPQSMFETDGSGVTRIDLRCARGYVSHSRKDWIAASFSLPKGMSGAPLIRKTADQDYVVGVFVGQTRGEEIEDLVEETSESGSGGAYIRVERVARVEYFARGELLQPFADFTAAEFGGLTLSELIAGELSHADRT